MADNQPEAADTTAERAVLGAMLLDPSTIDPVAAILDPTDYLEARHQTTHRAITTLHGRGIIPDPLTVLRQLQTDGTLRPGYLDGPYLHTLIATVPTTANATHYAHQVAEDARRRAVTTAAQRLVQTGGDPGQLAAIQADLAALTGPRPHRADGRRMRAVRASQIGMRATRWLWATTDDHATAHHHWLPLVGLSLLGGREGIGKSTWAYRIAAQVTTGTLPGDLYGHPRSVVIAATEDDWQATIVPRLAAADADLDRVLRIDVVEDGEIEGLSLPADIPELRDLCRDEDVALIVLDPLLGTISSALDTHKDAEVRKALSPLSQLASDAGVAIIGLIHANKSQGVDLLTRLMASRAFAAVARAVLYAGKEPTPETDEEAPGGPERYLLGQIKSNLGAKVTQAVRYHPEGVTVGHDQELDKPIRSSRIVVDDLVPGYLEELLADQPKTTRVDTAEARAVKWLRSFLAGGPVESAKVKAAAIDAGHTVRTLERAKASLDVLSTWAAGVHGTAWSLPHVSAGGVGVVGAVGGVGGVGGVTQTGTSKAVVSGMSNPANPPRPPAPGVRAPARVPHNTTESQEPEERSCRICYRPTTSPSAICDRHEPPDDTDEAPIDDREWYR